MPVYNFKKMAPVPSAPDLVDIVLMRTQRKTPTVIHPGYKIQRIRAFYMRKIKFTQQTISERLGQILSDFPRLNDIHPFYADLCNTLYDRDHYKVRQLSGYLLVMVKLFFREHSSYIFCNFNYLFSHKLNIVLLSQHQYNSSPWDRSTPPALCAIP